MTWAQRLKRFFNIDIKTCKQCGGALKVITSIEEPLVIEKILSHLNEKKSVVVPDFLPEDRHRLNWARLMDNKRSFHKYLCMKQAVESTMDCACQSGRNRHKIRILRKRITNSDNVLSQ